jgi:hypothetical protein
MFPRQMENCHGDKPVFDLSAAKLLLHADVKPANT